jgi:hypothetical protein
MAAWVWSLKHKTRLQGFVALKLLPDDVAHDPLAAGALFNARRGRGPHV